MKLVMTLLVWNAEDTIRENLTYHRAQGVDFFIVTDHLSTDSTVDILQSFEKRGWLHLIHERSETYEQGTWVTRMARLAALEFAADWLIHNDADEFWWPVKGSLKSTLAGLDSNTNVAVARRSNYVFTPKPWYRGRSTFLDLIYREVTSKNALGAPLPPKVAHRAHPDVIMPNGNHHVENIGTQCIAYNALEVFHYPVRSREQWREKILVGFRPVIDNAAASAGGMFGTWKYLHRKASERDGFNTLLKEYTYTPKRIRQALKEGNVVLDMRLRDFIKKLDQQPLAE